MCQEFFSFIILPICDMFCSSRIQIFSKNEWYSVFVIGANAIESGNKQINFLRREFKMAGELHGVCGVDNANAR